jgi:hypothetical protein
MGTPNIGKVNTAVLVIQKALLGRISKNVRAITLESIDNQMQGEIALHFYYNREVSAEDTEDARYVQDKLKAALPCDQVNLYCTRKDYPELIYSTGYWIFGRRE